METGERERERDGKRGSEECVIRDRERYEKGLTGVKSTFHCMAGLQFYSFGSNCFTTYK